MEDSPILHVIQEWPGTHLPSTVNVNKKLMGKIHHFQRTNPRKMASFHSYVSHYQRVSCSLTMMPWHYSHLFTILVLWLHNSGAEHRVICGAHFRPKICLRCWRTRRVCMFNHRYHPEFSHTDVDALVAICRSFP